MTHTKARDCPTFEAVPTKERNATMSSKYTVTQYPVSWILEAIKNNEIAIPEIQRPFIWKASQVRDLIDSLYNDYPTGYLVIWQNPTVRLKDGTSAVGKKVLIDGQQRVTALMTAITGLPILTEDYDEKPFRIAFNPIAKGEEERFAVTTPAHEKSSFWIPDISKLFQDNFDSYDFINDYTEKNPNVPGKQVNQALSKVLGIVTRSMGVIQLEPQLDIQEVTEIFVRINSQGKRLNEADFAMSKIAADQQYGGYLLRKAIDYFCHLCVDSGFYQKLKHADSEFTSSLYAPKLDWIKDGIDDIYTPEYNDMLRVSFMSMFNRAKLGNLVSLLSGRDFKELTFKEEIVADSFQKLSAGVMNFMNQQNFTQFLLAIKSAGFRSPKLLNSKMTLDFSYTLYLILQGSGTISKTEIPRYIKKWFVLATLTGRYVGSPESKMDSDLRQIETKGFLPFFQEIESANLSDTFWKVGLVQNLETSSVNSPAFSTFLAAQVYEKDTSLLSKSVKVEDLITVSGDIHHIFPKKYLKQNGIDQRSLVNQVANYAYLDSVVNKSIGKSAPGDYFTKALNQCAAGTIEVGTVTEEQDFWKNLEANCIPQSVLKMTAPDYREFLSQRRRLMAAKIRRYYESL